ncbi:hypothetical protein P8452_26828 [Trifolium repens]|nr:hypothetical protein P8452_26828 [Trifolium repens]
MNGEVNWRRIYFLSFANVGMFNYKRRKAKGTRGSQRSSCCPTDGSSSLLNTYALNLLAVLMTLAMA